MKRNIENIIVNSEPSASDKPNAYTNNGRRNQVKIFDEKMLNNPHYRDWVRRSEKGNLYVYCLACKQDYKYGKSEVDKHASSKKHTENMALLVAKNNYESYHSDECSTNSIEDFNDIISASSEPTPSKITILDSGSDSNSAVSTATDTANTNHALDDAEYKNIVEKFLTYELKRIKNPVNFERTKCQIMDIIKNALLDENN